MTLALYDEDLEIPSPSAVQGLLQALGTTGRHVARRLVEASAEGQRGDLRACPLAKHLRDLGCRSAEVDPGWVSWEDGRRLHFVDLPPGCVEFVRQFDRGDYPELVGASDA